MGGVTAVFEMPNTNPTTTSAQALADKVARAHHRMHCDFAFFVGGTRENTHELPALERLPGCAGVKVFMGSSTGSLLVEDDDGVRNILEVIRRRASFHSEDEYRLQRAQAPARRRRSALASGLARRACRAPVHAAAGPARARDRQARACAAHHDRAGDGVSQGPQGRRLGRGDAASSHARGARLLRAPRHAGADESAGARRRHRAGIWWGVGAGHRRRARLRPCARTRARKRPSPIPRRRPA